MRGMLACVWHGMSGLLAGGNMGKACVETVRTRLSDGDRSLLVATGSCHRRDPRTRHSAPPQPPSAPWAQPLSTAPSPCHGSSNRNSTLQPSSFSPLLRLPKPASRGSPRQTTGRPLSHKPPFHLASSPFCQSQQAVPVHKGAGRMSGATWPGRHSHRGPLRCVTNTHFYFCQMYPFRWYHATSLPQPSQSTAELRR